MVAAAAAAVAAVAAGYGIFRGALWAGAGPLRFYARLSAARVLRSSQRQRPFAPVEAPLEAGAFELLDAVVRQLAQSVAVPLVADPRAQLRA